MGLAWEDFLGGAAAGVAQTLAGQPFDTVKVRMQTNPSAYPSVGVCLRRTLGEGPLAFYKGTLSPLLGSAVCNSIQFGTMEASKRWFRRRSGGAPLRRRELFVSGVAAGVANTPVLAPMELVRIKMQVQATTGTRYSGSLDCLRQLWREHGLRGVYQGAVPSLLREGLGFGFFFSSYELVVGSFCRPGETVADLEPSRILIGGSLAGLAFWVPTFPIDVIKSRIQADSLTKPEFRGTLHCARVIYERHGLQGFYRGFTPCVARSLPTNACAFFAFETTMRWVGRRTDA